MHRLREKKGGINTHPLNGVSNIDQTIRPSAAKLETMVNLPQATVGDVARDRMQAPSCQECAQLLIDYSAAVFEHVKLNGQLKLAAQSGPAGQYRPAAHAAEVAADKRAAAQRKMKEHKALHGELSADVAIG